MHWWSGYVIWLIALYKANNIYIYIYIGLLLKMFGQNQIVDMKIKDFLIELMVMVVWLIN